MATLKLKNKPAPRAADRPPVRNAKPRPTLSQAQAQREDRRRQRVEADGPPPAAAPGSARPARVGERREGRPGGRADTRQDRRPQDSRDSRDARDSRGPRGPRGPGDARPEGRSAAGGRPAHGGPRGDQPRSHPAPRDGFAPARPRPPARKLAPPVSAPVEARSPGPKPEAKQPPGSGERLSKRLGELGLASRREADDWIAAGWVRVNGQMAVLGQRVTAEDRIEVDPAAREQQARQVTILLHKPIGYVSGQAEDGHEPAWVLVTPDNRWADDPSGVKYHPGHLRHLAPAGRLDIDSTGLLVLTQDGRVAKALIGDDSLVEKEYLVRVEYTRPGPVPDEAIALLNHGLELDGVQLRPAKVSWQNEEQLRVVLREGRKRQIRRMCEAVGLKVLALKRVRIGRIPLAALPVGQWRYLAPHEKF